MFHVIANANSIVQLPSQIKNGIMIYDNSSLKSILCAEKIIVGTPARVFLCFMYFCVLTISNQALFHN